MEKQAYYAMLLFSLISVAYAQETESSTKSNLFITPRIIGGSDVLPGTYPWFARGVVSYWGAFTFWTGCGGSLISENHVLTAGHCIDDTFRNIGAFQIGALNNLYINGWNGGQYVEYRSVDAIVLHPSFSSESLDYDLAIVKLKQPCSIDPVDIDDGRFSPNYVHLKKNLWPIGKVNRLLPFV